MAWSTLIMLACLAAYAHAHGRVNDPPNRASLWRFGYNTRANYDDDGLNCGGFHHQWNAQDGKCGVCGDAYDSALPRAHELGGRYGDGIIVAKYKPGDIITFTVLITAYHRGFWEFKICTDPYDITQECYDKILLETEDGETKYYPVSSGLFKVNYKIPSNLVCDHCVLQWKYTAGNNWGVCDNGTGAFGCGNQENFFSCSDITIEGDVRLSEGPNDIPVELPLSKLNEDILRLLILTNEIRDDRPSYGDPSRKKYMNRHKRKKTSKKEKQRRFKKILYQR